MPSFSASAGSTSITVTYKNPGSYIYYRVYWRPDGGTTSQSAWRTTTGDGYTYNITGLTPGTRYTVNVRYKKSASETASIECGAQYVTTASSGYSIAMTMGVGMKSITYHTSNDSTRHTMTNSVTYTLSSGGYICIDSVEFLTGYTYPVYGTPSASGGQWTIFSGNGSSNDPYINVYSSNRSVTVYAGGTKTPEYYYRVRVYEDGLYSGIYADSSVTTTGTPTVSVATARNLVEPISGYVYSYAEAGSNCSLSGSTFTLSTNSADTDYLALLNLYYVPNNYQYTITLMRNQTSSDSVSRGYPTTSGTSRGQTLGIPNGNDIWTYAGHSFIEWNTDRNGGGASYSGGTTYTFYEDKTLYAIWSVNSYWMGADIASGSSTGVDSVYVNNVEWGTNVTYGNSATWSCSLITGYAFVGWYDYNGTLYSTNQTYTRSNVSASLTLYARAQKRTYWMGADVESSSRVGVDSVYVNNNGGGTYVSYGETAEWSCSLNLGYTFTGWYDSNGTFYSNQNPYNKSQITSALTLYARASATKYTASASSDGYGTCFTSVSVSDDTPTYGSYVTFTATLSDQACYKFRGWYSNTTSSTPVSTSASHRMQITGNTKLYARADVQWEYGVADSAGLKKKFSGGTELGANEWGKLQAYVSQRRGGYSYSNIARVGEGLTALLFNETAKSINDAGSGSIETNKARGVGVYASDLNLLITEANKL